jgi:methyltransferase (TIGR00027 family)
MQEQLINNVSDTALWIAAYRALESERPDAVFKDPLARKLAGEKGFKMVEATPIKEHMAFAIVTRTTGIDWLIDEAIKRGIDTVINLGAGLDTRPYRMPLPVNLRWVEVDFPHMIEYKNQQLANEIPACHLQRIAADLSNNEERKALLTRLGNETKRALIITEGVVAYLTNEQATQLSRDIFAIPNFHYWIMDYHPESNQRNPRTAGLKKILANAPFRFQVHDPIAFFTGHGWKVHDNIYILDEADRIGRQLPSMKFPYNVMVRLFPKKARELGNKTYGYVLFGK